MRKSVGQAPTAERANKRKKKVSDRLLQRSGRTNAKKIVSDVTRHRSGMGKSLCRTRSGVGSERVKLVFAILLYFIEYEINHTRPVQPIGSVCWRNKGRRLTVLENVMLRKIFVLEMDKVTGGCWKLHNEELHDFYLLPGIIRVTN